MNVSIVIPVYMNAEGLNDLSRVLHERESDFEQIGCDMEVIFVIDGSPDSSFEILSELKRDNLLPRNSKLVKLSRNFGQIPAILAGLEISKGECVICYSADMQDPSSLFLPMYENFRLGNEIVIATRESRDDGFLWDLSSKLGYYLLRREVPLIPQGGFDFFLVGSHAKKILMERAGSKRFLQGDLMQSGFSPVEIRFIRSKRKHGKSAYSFKKRLMVFTDAFYDSTDLPIKIMTRLGFGLAIFGLISSLLVVVSYLRGLSPFNGFTAIACAILVLGGLQLVLIGIIGEYVYRIYDIARNRPSYVIQSIS